MSNSEVRGGMSVWSRIAVLLVVALFVAACGPGDGTADPSDPEGTETTQADRSDGGEDTLAAFFGWDDFDENQWRDDEARRQELIRQCMAEQGFEYIPIQYPDSPSAVTYDEEEMARTHGFWITTWFGNEEEFEVEEAWEDPNHEIAEAMSDSEREAYYAALYGSADDWDAQAITEVDPETGEEYQYIEGWGSGCEGQASEQVYGGMNGGSELWEELEPQMTAMWERIQADPRIVDLNEDWSKCMADAGYNISSQQDLWDWEGDGLIADLQRRFDELIGDYWSGRLFDDWSEDEWQAFYDEHTEDEIEAFFRDADEAARSSVDMDAIAALQQEEIDLAVANYECNQELNWNEAYEEISQEYERDFIAANRGLLEQIREAQGG